MSLLQWQPTSLEKLVGPEEDRWLLGCLAGEVALRMPVEREVGCGVLTGRSVAVAGGRLIAVWQLLEVAWSQRGSCWWKSGRRVRSLEWRGSNYARCPVSWAWLPASWGSPVSQACRRSGEAAIPGAAQSRRLRRLSAGDEVCWLLVNCLKTADVELTMDWLTCERCAPHFIQCLVDERKFAEHWLASVLGSKCELNIERCLNTSAASNAIG